MCHLLKKKLRKQSFIKEKNVFENSIMNANIEHFIVGRSAKVQKTEIRKKKEKKIIVRFFDGQMGIVEAFDM
jgi:hypothetical protein